MHAAPRVPQDLRADRAETSIGLASRLLLGDSMSRPATTALAPHAAAVEATRFDTVTTQLAFASPPTRVWDGLMFYEQLAERPPWYLRALLPVPIRTEGRKSEVGDEARCIYEDGYLIKRVTQVDPGRLYAFAVTVQELRVGNTMRLSNGSYELCARADGGTDVVALTRYQSARRPRWLWRAIEAQVCHLFHRHILRAMRAKIDGGR